MPNRQCAFRNAPILETRKGLLASTEAPAQADRRTLSDLNEAAAAADACACSLTDI
jgi:hypothetical protein